MKFPSAELSALVILQFPFPYISGPRLSPVPPSNTPPSSPPPAMMPSYHHSWTDSPPSVSASLKEPHRLHQQPSSSAYHDSKDKPKKPRHRHSAYQLAALNELYDKDEHPPLEERTSLAERLGMSVSLSVLLLCRNGRLMSSLCWPTGRSRPSMPGSRTSGPPQRSVQTSPPPPQRARARAAESHQTVSTSCLPSRPFSPRSPRPARISTTTR